GQSAPEGRTVRAHSRELAEALVGWRTVRPRGADSPAQIGGQSATVPESLQRLWWDSGQSGQKGRTVRDRSRELAEALVGSRTVRPRWADGPPLFFKFVPERLFLWSGLKS